MGGSETPGHIVTVTRQLASGPPGPSGPADPVSTSHPVGRGICATDGGVKARPSYR